MFLGVKTDSPVAELYMYDENGTQLSHRQWQANREMATGLLGQIERLLKESDMSFSDLQGVFVYTGPGSFTGLRIGITVINTLSYGLSVPVVGSTGKEEDWTRVCVDRLRNGEDDRVVLPFYGADPRITQPKK